MEALVNREIIFHYFFYIVLFISCSYCIYRSKYFLFFCQLSCELTRRDKFLIRKVIDTILQIQHIDVLLIAGEPEEESVHFQCRTR